MPCDIMMNSNFQVFFVRISILFVPYVILSWAHTLPSWLGAEVGQNLVAAPLTPPLFYSQKIGFMVRRSPRAFHQLQLCSISSGCVVKRFFHKRMTSHLWSMKHTMSFSKPLERPANPQVLKYKTAANRYFQVGNAAYISSALASNELR